MAKSKYDQTMAEATEGLEKAQRKAREQQPVQRFPKGSTSKEKCETLARTLVEKHGWIVNTEAIRKVGLNQDDEPVITVLVHSPGQGKDGRAYGSGKATFQRWASGAAILSGELPEGVACDIRPLVEATSTKSCR
jgi:hypothetical protein